MDKLLKNIYLQNELFKELDRKLIETVFYSSFYGEDYQPRLDFEDESSPEDDAEDVEF